MARRAIIDGVCDAALAGGADSPITPIAIDSFCVLGALSRHNDAPERASRPFDRDRDGFVIAEGATMVVVEELEHARRRGAPIYGEILGDRPRTNERLPHDEPCPSGGGPLARRNTGSHCRVPGCGHRIIQYINAHGTSTSINDRTETGALKAAFGDWAYNVPISSTKGVIGHMQGAASANQVGGALPDVTRSSPAPDDQPRESRSRL